MTGESQAMQSRTTNGSLAHWPAPLLLLHQGNHRSCPQREPRRADTSPVEFVLFTRTGQIRTPSCTIPSRAEGCGDPLLPLPSSLHALLATRSAPSAALLVTIAKAYSFPRMLSPNLSVGQQAPDHKLIARSLLLNECHQLKQPTGGIPWLPPSSSPRDPRSPLRPCLCPAQPTSAVNTEG